MARQPRLDAPGLLHHVMVRGLNRQPIFTDRADYGDLLRRIPVALERSPNEILAWALMPNHLHFLLRSGRHGVASFMRRLLSGYAVGFNKRHHRVGYLFQGRFKSLVCEEEEYFLTLVRYIHLNPVVAGLTKSVATLGDYPYAGHGALMGRAALTWQTTDEVLGRFGDQAGIARRRYATFLEEGLPEVSQQPTDLLGAGLLEYLHGSYDSFRREGDQSLRDTRVLGESEFVAQVWRDAEAREKVRKALQRKGMGLRGLVRRVAAAHGVQERQLLERGRRRDISVAKAALIHAAVEYLGRTTQEMAALTRMSGPAASKARLRGALHLKPALRGLLS